MRRRRFGFMTSFVSVGAGLWAFLFAGSTTHVMTTAPQAATAGVVSPQSAKGRAGAGPEFGAPLDVATFQRGNLHAHTSKSDGDRSPEDVYRWYRDHGYAFLAITDHNRLTLPVDRRAIETPGFAVIPGEEITMVVRGRPVHVNALCTTRAIGARPDRPLNGFQTVGGALEWAVASVRRQGGVALVNHPNYGRAVTAEDLPGARGAALLEIWSGHLRAHSAGDAQRPSAESIWETALGAGQSFAAVAVDDMHRLADSAPASAARPGRAWVEVFASEPTQPAICAALSAGRLYASSGARLKRISVLRDAFAVWPSSAGARVEFIGDGGQVLEAVTPDNGAPAQYRLRGGERWVRARVTVPDGGRAWTQPMPVAP
jgi:hypothetical protein